MEGIRRTILDGFWSPGDRLQPTTLAEQFETSTTVIRESLTWRTSPSSTGAGPPRRGRQASATARRSTRKSWMPLWLVMPTCSETITVPPSKWSLMLG
ncbi:GntR family transcriptional regulator [Glutamicibacter nicotianae]|uniref:GntR family transcriptional regulator n=1 Tax=Glutamicibacter nicotianae TaxID=37929 RepID=UPI0019580269